MSGLRTALLAILVLVPCAVLLLDRPISTAMHGFGRPALAVWLTHIADWPVPLAIVVLMAGGLGALAGWRPGSTGQVVLAASVATLVARAGADGLKLAFGRPWPETWVDANPSWIGTHVFGFFPFHGGRGYASFPSGHMVDIAAPCAVLWRTVPRGRWGRWLAALLVTAVAAGLVASDFHFVSDVLSGLGLGIAAGYGVAALMAA